MVGYECVYTAIVRMIQTLQCAHVHIQQLTKDLLVVYTNITMRASECVYIHIHIVRMIRTCSCQSSHRTGNECGCVQMEAEPGHWDGRGRWFEGELDGT